MTISEIKDEYFGKLSKIQKEAYEKESKIREKALSDCCTFLAEHGLERLVKKKDTGEIGTLKFDSKWIEFKFYRMTKKGEISKNPFWKPYTDDVLEWFEPYKGESK